MADLSQTATSVVRSDGGTKVVVWGEAVTAGMPVYLHTDSKYYKAQSDGTLAQATVAGIALSGGSTGQTGVIQVGGSINVGATLTKGTIYYVSTNAGGICPFADLGSGNYVHQLGQATSTSLLAMSVNNSGITI
jgi:hypothetical protein